MGDWVRATLERRAGQGSPFFWLLLLGAGLPWLRVELWRWPLYPAHLALAGVWAGIMVRERALGAGAPLSFKNLSLQDLPLKGPLALCAYVALLAALRGEWLPALGTVGATAANFAWGWGAWRLGREASREDALVDGMILLLGASIALELVLWAVAGYLPAGCLLLNCPPPRLDLPLFRGGWDTPAQFAQAIALMSPLLLPPLVLAWIDPRAGASRRVLTALAALLLLGLAAGTGAWWLAMAAALAAGLYRVLAPWGGAPMRRLLRGMAVALVALPAVLYALFPSYALRWFQEGGGAGGRVLLRLAEGEAPRLTSRGTTMISLELSNVGPRTLPAPLRIVPRLLITPARGATRAYEGASLVLSRSLAPGERVRVAVPVRLPPYVERGFLAWWVESGEGIALALARGSDPGFRFANIGWEPLRDEGDNLLSAVAQRARDYDRQTFAPEPREPEEGAGEKILGDVLDTLFFSPLWGEAKNAGGTRPLFPFTRPFLLQLLAGYGLIGLAWVLVLGWEVARRAEAVGRHATGVAARLAWRLVPVSLVSLGVLALFSPAPGSYPGQWGLFLLVGFVEGRHDRLFPSQPSSWWQRLPRVPWRLSWPGLPGGWRRVWPRLPLRLRLPRPRWPGRARRSPAWPRRGLWWRLRNLWARSRPWPRRRRR